MSVVGPLRKVREKEDRERVDLRSFLPGFGEFGAVSRTWGAYLVLWMLATSVYLLIPYLEVEALILYTVLAVLALAAVVTGVRVHRPDRSLA